MPVAYTNEGDFEHSSLGTEKDPPWRTIGITNSGPGPLRLGGVTTPKMATHIGDVITKKWHAILRGRLSPSFKPSLRPQKNGAQVGPSSSSARRHRPLLVTAWQKVSPRVSELGKKRSFDPDPSAVLAGS